MPVYLFHQNMKRMGGGVAVKNFAYNAAYAGIAAALPVGSRIAVAGFTEILNNGLATAVLTGGMGGGGLNLSGQLGAVVSYTVGCGQTALNNQQMEYIAIAVHAADAPNLVGIGRIMINAGGHAIQLIDDYLAIGNYGANWANNTPANATFDYRGLVYVTLALHDIVTNTNTPIAVGFLHNRYGNSENGGQAERAMTANQLPGMAAILRNRAAGGEVYIGGDFNVGVLATRHNAQAVIYSYARATTPIPNPAVGPAPKQQAPVGATPGGTTWAGSLYDYWFSSIDPTVLPAPPLIVPVPDVDTATLDSNSNSTNGGVMSDHAGALLAIAT